MSKEEPQFVRLMDATGTVVLDSVAAEYEDSFCLDAFGDSIKSAESAEPKGTKHFIIARVQTWDHKQPDRAFYSYYHAHHLNKLLFQTQVYLEKKLIHRLHVLNPLTNTDIIGNVLYFMVIGKSKRNRLGQVVKIPNETNAASPPRAVDSSADSRSPNMNLDVAALAVPPSPSVSKLPPFQNPITLNMAIHNQGPSSETIPEEDEEEDEEAAPKSSKSVHEDIAKTGWTITEAVSADTNEDGQSSKQLLGEGERPKSSPTKSMVSAVARRVSQSAQKVKGFVPLGENDEEQDIGSPQGDHVMIDMSKTKPKTIPGLKVSTDFAKVSGPQSASIGGAGRAAEFKQGPKSAYARTTNPTDNLICPTSATRLKAQTPAPSGTITQRGEKISPLQALSIVPPSARSRRRSLSYMNAVQTSGSTSASLDDWKRMLKTDKAANEKSEKSEEKTKLDQAAGKYDEVKPIQLATPQSPAEPEEIFFDAILIATDNDFLESSRVRAIFKENALNPADSQLFEMPAYTGEVRVHRGPHNYEDAPLPCDCCFPTDEQLRASPVWLRFFHECKCYALLMVLTVALVVFIAKA